MNDLDVERLRSIGLAPAMAPGLWRHLEAARATAAGPHEAARGAAPYAARVTEVQRETLRVHDGHAELGVRVHPTLVRRLLDDGDALAVGDWVIVHADAHGGGWITQCVPPLARLVRRDGDGRRHVVVSNVDTALLVMGLDHDFSVRRLERYLAIVHGTGVTPVVVLTKRDLVAAQPGALPLALEQLRGRVPVAVDVLAVDGTAAATAALLQPYLAAGQTVVLLGSSGAGKSTLTNTLLGGAVRDTGAVRTHDSRGRHTTTARTLLRLPGGACVIDTPGLRALRPDGDETRVAASFEDIATLAAACRFRDCTHKGEPGCAVTGAVPADRLHNYHKLLREMRRDTMTALDRREERSRWKAIDKGVGQRMRAKRGGYET